MVKQEEWDIMKLADVTGYTEVKTIDTDDKK